MSTDLSEFLAKNRDALRRPVLLDVVCDRLRNWSVPGALLIGDASHPMSPVGGQGINIALRDAIVAANHLGGPLAEGASAEAIDAAVKFVEVERMPEIAAIQDLQQLGPQLLFSSSRLSRLLTSVPIAKLIARFFTRLFLARMRPFLYGVADVRSTSLISSNTLIP